MKTLLLVTALCLGTNDTDARAALKRVLGQHDQTAREALLSALCCDDYAALCKQAIDQNKPLIVGVGCTPPEGDWLTCRVDFDFFDNHPIGIVVAKPRGGKLVWLDSLPCNAWWVEVKVILDRATGVTPGRDPWPVAPVSPTFSVRGGSC